MEVQRRRFLDNLQPWALYEIEYVYHSNKPHWLLDTSLTRQLSILFTDNGEALHESYAFVENIEELTPVLLINVTSMRRAKCPAWSMRHASITYNAA